MLLETISARKDPHCCFVFFVITAKKMVNSLAIARLTEERKQWRKDHPYVSSRCFFWNICSWISCVSDIGVCSKASAEA